MGTKLSFIKLDIEIMNDSKVKIIRKMPGGSSYFELWIGLLCLAMKSGRPGCVEVGDGIPFTTEMLSAELDLEQNTVRMGLELFERLRMIEYFEDQTIYLLNFEKHQELTRIEEKKYKERQRKQLYRDKIKKLSHGTGRGQDADGTFCPTIDIDKDKDTDIDKEAENAFLTFWHIYPKKEGRKKSREKFISLYKKGSLPPIDSIVEIIEKWMRTKKWIDGFIPLPLTWLNGERWEDELPVEKSAISAEKKNFTGYEGIDPDLVAFVKRGDKNGQ